MCRQVQMRYHLSVHNGDIRLYTASIVNMSSVSGIPWGITEEELLYRLEFTVQLCLQQITWVFYICPFLTNPKCHYFGVTPTTMLLVVSTPD